MVIQSGNSAEGLPHTVHGQVTTLLSRTRSVQPQSHKCHIMPRVISLYKTKQFYVARMYVCSVHTTPEHNIPHLFDSDGLLVVNICVTREADKIYSGCSYDAERAYLEPQKLVINSSPTKLEKYLFKTNCTMNDESKRIANTNDSRQ